MIINGTALLDAAPIVDMVPGKMVGPGGTSFGLGEAGYDIRLAEEVLFEIVDGVPQVTVNGETTTGRLHWTSSPCQQIWWGLFMTSPPTHAEH